ncbi:hypothetical protein [Leptolyngbya sp. FACHB-17]|uniref:hypothetical protein n=1 Tax=unclassified Leptolyngbya TaxID=2650499 RepID=UPI0016811438|nr:hypothetical protein [Leptolyngbya sp. FACHB-17]MBD2080840.1 hypothetical protein [Leptolyngbya sp. FACHB-17]
MGGSAAQALTLVQYDFGTPPGVSTMTLAPTTTAANISASNLSGGSGGNLQTGVATNPATINFGNYSAFFPVSTTSAAAVANNSYFEFTVTLTGGSQWNLNFLSFDASRVGSGSSYASFALRSSLNNFGSDIGGVQTTTNSFPTFSPMTFSLTAPAYQNLAAPITFRVYVFGELRLDPRIASPARALFDNVTLNGTPATPIPFAFTPLPGLALTWVTGAARRIRSHPQALKKG